MNEYEQKIKQLISATPSWEKDGSGIRGRSLVPLMSGSSGPNLTGDQLPQQFIQQKSDLIQQQDDPLPKLNLPSLGGGETILPPHPWQVLLRTTEDEVTEYKVELNSNLYSGIGSWDNINITGLDFWTEISEGFLVLFGVVDGGVCTEASIQGPQDVPSDRIDFVDDEQSSFASQIAYLFQDGDSWRVRQLCFQDLTLMNVCIDGVACVYPFAV